jgi:hypothetical protein
VVVFFSFVLIWILKPFPLKKRKEFEKDQSLENWQKSGRARRFFLYPLNFAITPIGTYSISIAQVLLWTYVTIFGIVYIHWLTGRFIDITEQVLMLLGIGGGTALAAKINAVSRVKELPSKYLNMIKKKRIPRLKDLISGAVYLGNEFSQKNVWDEITSKVDAIEAYAKNNNKPVSSAEEIKALKISEVDELINLLKGIYA